MASCLETEAENGLGFKIYQQAPTSHAKREGLETEVWQPAHTEFIREGVASRLLDKVEQKDIFTNVAH